MKTTPLARRLYLNWRLYVFLLLPVVYILIFAYYPMLGLQLAFKKFNISQGIWGSPWVGLANFRRFFQSYQFKRVIGNTLSLSLYGLVAGFPLPIIFALMLNAMRSDRYRRFIQTVTYIPHFISTVVIVGMILQLFNPRVGLYGALGQLISGGMPPDILGRATAFSHLYVWSGIWQGLGWNAIVYLAALAAVEPELHEAAEIDGANRFQRVLHIDLQGILPTSIILLILRAGQIMNVGFEKAYLMQNNMNIAASEVISTYVYKVGLYGATGDFAFGTAIGLFNSVINLLLLMIVNTASKRVSEQSLW